MHTPTHTLLPQPDLARVDIATVLQALSDPIRLRIVRELDIVGEATCSSLDVPVKVSTASHHVRILRESGVVSTRIDGTSRPSHLRRAELEHRFPGLLAAVLGATPPSPGADQKPLSADSSRRPAS
ncbi:ArsR/SmtB family transcription factor [Embleya sp. NPDC050154]|uniref:ArsR/SmtB family transcription factor n=1 Tax=unclassified Embleya TaxID=2699296 RepID=UPI0037BD673C